MLKKIISIAPDIPGVSMFSRRHLLKNPNLHFLGEISSLRTTVLHNKESKMVLVGCIYLLYPGSMANNDENVAMIE